jgi:hypothetical protein
MVRCGAVLTYDEGLRKGARLLWVRRTTIVSE